MEKRDTLKYLVIGLIFAGLAVLLFFLRLNLTGYAVFEDFTEGDFNNGTYYNLTYNGSAVVLVGENLSGSYVSQIFDAGSDALWNNLSWEGVIEESINVYLSSAFHLGVNKTEVFNQDGVYYLADMKDSSKKFYFNFSKNLINGSVLKIYAKKNKGIGIGIYNYSDAFGSNPFGTFVIDSVSGNWYNISLNIEGGTKEIWFGEGTGSGLDPKDEFDYVYAEVPGTNLSFQVKNCSLSDCSEGVWQNIDLDNLSLISRFFQYKVVFTSPDSSLTPVLESVSINYNILNTAPSIILASPQDGATYGYNESIALNFSLSDAEDNIDSCWYNLNREQNNSLIGCTNTTFNVAGNGDYILNIYVKDSLGEESMDSTSFNVQVGAPTILLHSPIDVYLNYQNIEFNYTPTDSDLDSCELWGNFTGDFILNQTEISPVSSSVNSFFLNLTDRVYLWNIKCNDSVGNSAFNGNKTFYVDTINPDLVLSEPTGSKTSRIVSAGWSVNDSSPLSCVYNVYQGASPDITNTSVDCSANSVSFEVSSDGSFIFNFYVSDSADNSNSASLSFSVDTSSGTSPEGDSSGGGGGGSGALIINTTKAGKLDVSNIGNIIAHGGEKKTLSLDIKNSGKIFLNNCKLKVDGEISSWIYSNQVEGIAPGENKEFIFDLNVPEGIKAGDYSGKLEIKCSEGNSVQKISVSIPGLASINIKDIKQNKNVLTIVYEFDNLEVIGDNAFVDVWLEDSEGYEITRFQDVFGIKKDGLIERTVEFELENAAGIYYVYLALSNDLSNFVRESVVLGGNKGTGRVIFDTTQGKIGIYAIFLIIIAIAIFFIWRKHGKAEHPKHHWFFEREKKKQKK